VKLLTDISLSKKLTGIILLVTFFALSIGFTIYTISAVNQQKNDFKNSMVVNAKLIGDYSISPIVFDDRRGANDILKKLSGIPEVISAHIFINNGDLFASYYKKDTISTPTFKENAQAEFEGNILAVYEPIELDQQNYGMIYLRVSTSLLSSKIRDQLLLMVALFVGILLISWILARKIQSLVSDPLLNLAAATNKVSKEGDYSVRVERISNDEIGLLYDQFNHMIEQIEARQAAIVRSEKKYRNLYQNSLVGMYRTEIATGKIIDANDAAARIFGLNKRDNTKMLQLYKDINERNRMMEELVEEGFIDNYEIELKKANGSSFWASISGQLFDNNQYFEGVIQDITEKKENFIKLKKANFELDSFVYHASHDLRSPLLSILGLVNLSKYEADANKLHEFMGMIKKSITKLDTLISDLLVLSRDNRINDKFRQIDVEKQIYDCIENYDFLEGFNKINITVDVKGETPLVSDLTRFTIVLNNLISNAIKYHRKDIDNPEIKISTEVTEEKCTIRVADNGEGISKEYQKQIFDMFYRISDESDGSGLGLYIVKNVLDKLDGKITLESEPDKGTTFTVEIPNSQNVEELEEVNNN